MEFRFLGNSGLKVSAISYGNWARIQKAGRSRRPPVCTRR
jgi:aryl-alcohol dehydrogenase-like predicted oxidoreductase